MPNTLFFISTIFFELSLSVRKFFPFSASDVLFFHFQPQMCLSMCLFLQRNLCCQYDYFQPNLSLSACLAMCLFFEEIESSVPINCLLTKKISVLSGCIWGRPIFFNYNCRGTAAEDRNAIGRRWRERKTRSHFSRYFAVKPLTWWKWSCRVYSLVCLCLFLCLSRLEPRVLIHPVNPNPPPLTVLLLTNNFSWICCVY